MSRLQELPPELLANIARFAGGRYRKGEREYLSRKDCGDLLMDLPAITPGDVLRLARGCPRLTSLDYSLDPVDSDDEPGSRLTDSGLSVADQSHIGDLFDLLESRCREANIPPRFQIKLLV